MTERVPVRRPVYDGIEAVRRSGLMNMFDRPAVALIAEQMDFEEAALWLREHGEEYARGIFHGLWRCWTSVLRSVPGGW